MHIVYSIAREVARKFSAALCRAAAKYIFPHMVFISSRNALLCSLVSVDHLTNNSFCSSDSPGTSSPSERNWITVMPKALQIASSVDKVGVLFLLNRFAIVDCDRPASIANLYLVHPRSSSSWLILFAVSTQQPSISDSIIPFN